MRQTWACDGGTCRGSLNSIKPLPPIARTPFHVHDRDDPKVIGLFQKDNGVGKIAAEMSPHRWIKFAESLRVGTDFAKHSFHFVIKTQAEVG